MNEMKKGFFEQETGNPVVGAFSLVILTGTAFFFLHSVIIFVFGIIEIIKNKKDIINDFTVLKNLIFSLYMNHKYLIISLIIFTYIIIFIFLTIFLFKRFHFDNFIDYFHLNKFNFLSLLIPGIGAVMLIPLVFFIINLSNKLLPGISEINKIYLPLLKINSIQDGFIISFALCFAAPACEEFLFRGYFQRTLQRFIQEPFHYLISGLIFSLFYSRIILIIIFFLAGVYFGFIFYKCNSFYAAFVSHVIFNSIILLIYNLNILNALFINDLNNKIFYLILIISLVFFTGIILIIIFYSKKIFSSFNHYKNDYYYNGEKIYKKDS